MLELLAGFVRGITYAGALVAVGGVLFFLLVHDGRHDERGRLLRIVSGATGTALFATMASIPVQAATFTGRGIGAVAEPGMLSALLAFDLGMTLWTRAVGLVILTIGLTLMLRTNRSVAGVLAAISGSVMTLLSFVLTGHSASVTPRWLVVPADFTHTFAAAAWFGGLVFLLMTLHQRRHVANKSGTASLIGRFSSLAAVAAVGVLVTGSALAWAVVGAPGELVRSAYGWTLSAKLALVALVVLAGVYNCRVLVPALTRSGRPRRQYWYRLRLTAAVECGLLLTVVAVTAALVTLHPPTLDR